MKKLQCEVCSGRIERKEKGEYECMYCGTNYSLESLRTIVSGSVEVVPGESTLERLVKNIEFQLDTRNYTDAATNIAELKNTFASDYRGYWFDLRLEVERLMNSKKLGVNCFLDGVISAKYDLLLRILRVSGGMDRKDLDKYIDSFVKEYTGEKSFFEIINEVESLIASKNISAAVNRLNPLLHLLHSDYRVNWLDLRLDFERILTNEKIPEIYNFVKDMNHKYDLFIRKITESKEMDRAYVESNINSYIDTIIAGIGEGKIRDAYYLLSFGRRYSLFDKFNPIYEEGIRNAQILKSAGVKYNFEVKDKKAWVLNTYGTGSIEFCFGRCLSLGSACSTYILDAVPNFPTDINKCRIWGEANAVAFAMRNKICPKCGSELKKTFLGKYKCSCGLTIS